MEPPPAKKDPVPELAEPPRRRTIKDWLILIAVAAVALPVLLFLLLIGLSEGNPRWSGPPHWTDRYVRAAVRAWWVLVLALFAYGLWLESQRR